MRTQHEINDSLDVLNAAEFSIGNFSPLSDALGPDYSNIDFRSVWKAYDHAAGFVSAGERTMLLAYTHLALGCVLADKGELTEAAQEVEKANKLWREHRKKTEETNAAQA